MDDLVRNGQGDLALIFEYDSHTRTVKIIGYAEPINSNGKFSERGVMNVYMEQAVLYSTLPDEERHDVLKYMDTRDKNEGKTIFLTRIYSARRHGCLSTRSAQSAV